MGLARDSGLGRFLATQASRSGRIPRHRVRLGGFDAIAQVVATGVGAAVMPDKAAARYCRAGTRIVALSDAWATAELFLIALAHLPATIRNSSDLQPFAGQARKRRQLNGGW